MLDNHMVYKGVSSAKYRTLAWPSNDNLQPPSRVMTKQEIPGKNGSLLYDEGYYENRKVKYDCITRGISEFNAFKNFLLSSPGYNELTDNFDPEYYFMAHCEDVSVTTSYPDGIVKSVITFNAKPQRFLTSGKDAIAVSGTTSIMNPTEMAACPLIIVGGHTGSSAGRITLRNEAFVQRRNIFLSSGWHWDGTKTVYIDTELQDAWVGTLAGMVLLDQTECSLDYGALFYKGMNTITVSDDLTNVTVIPRWWML